MTRLPNSLVWIALLAIHSPIASAAANGQADEVPTYESHIAPLLKTYCVKCHGPAKQEEGLNLSTAVAVATGNSNGAVIVPHDLEASKLWKQIESDQMPPDDPLPENQKMLIRKWILDGASGLSPKVASGEAKTHWSFRPLAELDIPSVTDSASVRNSIDLFVQRDLEAHGLNANPEADKRTLIRRVSLDVTGLPPTLEEIEVFLSDSSESAYARMVEHFLASPQYGVRWGKIWLDAVGYADSNGYFNADSDRPLAYRYRDYVVRSINQDKPFDQFIVEQIAGDELARFDPDEAATPQTIELLEATHFLRNGQDGSGESDGNPDEVRADRYYALESVMQNTSSALLGLTIQCAKCHDHKFEPLTQLDYYRWQAVFYPAFNIEKWVKPKDRFVYAPLESELRQWQQETLEMEQRVATLRKEFEAWAKEHRVRGELLFEAHFDGESERLSDNWSAHAPGDDGPGGRVPVNVDSAIAPAARINDGKLWIVEGGTQGDSWLSTKSKFDWTPNKVGDAIQVTFDLVDHKLPDSPAAERIGYFIALHDFDDNSDVPGGNLLIDGHPTEATSVHLDYPGNDSRALGKLGSTGYTPGNNYGVRITNIDNKTYRIEQLINSFPDEKTIDVRKADLPDGGFGFEYCCGRSFIVDNVLIEHLPSSPKEDSPLAEFKRRQAELGAAVQQQRQLVENRPGKISWATDMDTELPKVHLLTRGSYAAKAEEVEPSAFTVLTDESHQYQVKPSHVNGRSSGRRLAWAEWLIHRDSRAAALMARVQVNRVWQQYFGKGIVTTPENFGLSGAPPTHPELLDWLALELVRGDWKLKNIHRLILNSAAYRRSSALSPKPYEIDPNNRWLWRFAPRRLDAEAIRDQMLAVSGELNSKMGGPYIPTERLASGEVVSPEGSDDSLRRSIYLNQKRTQVVSFLTVFDAPSIVFNSVRRNTSTMSLQSLSLMNSDFAIRRARGTALQLQTQTVNEANCVQLAFQKFYSRLPDEIELNESLQFLNQQAAFYAERPDARQQAWQDLCQSLMASSEFLYID